VRVTNVESMTTTLSSQATVATEKPVPYMRQLCKQGRERLRNVVGSHLERFGKRDELTVSWS
jgi:hypothetical protein